MKLEHVALLVADPVAVAEWYEAHLGMRVVRKGDAPGTLASSPTTRARACSRSTRARPPCRTTPRWTRSCCTSPSRPDDVGATRARLIAAGATPVGEVVVTPAGDRFAMLRDPWGLALQLARRARPLV